MLLLRNLVVGLQFLLLPPTKNVQNTNEETLQDSRVSLHIHFIYLPTKLTL